MQNLDMRRIGLAIALAILGILAVGCASSPNGHDKTVTEYVLWVVLEKNLHSNQDHASVQFQSDDTKVEGGRVLIEGDAITSFDSQGRGQKTYTEGHWDTGAWIHIVALDSTGSVVYRDSVIIPGEFVITNVDPTEEPWRPSQPLPRIEWSTSNDATNYAISVMDRPGGGSAVGFADYYESNMGLSQTFQQDVFSDVFDNVIDDTYDIFVIASNPNFIAPNSHEYSVPDFDYIPHPINKDKISGGISALCVTPRETIVVETLTQ